MAAQPFVSDRIETECDPLVKLPYAADLQGRHFYEKMVSSVLYVFLILEFYRMLNNRFPDSTIDDSREMTASL